MGRPSPLTEKIIDFAAMLKDKNKTLNEIVAAIETKHKVKTSAPAISKVLTARTNEVHANATAGDTGAIKSEGLGGGVKTDLSGVSTAVRLGDVVGSAANPRQTFVDESIAELAASIQTKGLIQPLTVRPHPKKSGQYMLTAGERRWRAMRHLVASGTWADDVEIPITIRDEDARHALETALIENLQREDVPPLEEAQALKTLVDEMIDKGAAEHRKAACALLGQRLGKSGRHIELRLALVEKLSPNTQEALTKKKITLAHARAMTTGVELVDGQLSEEIIKLQDSILDDITDDWGSLTPKGVKETMTDELPELSWALFDPTTYTGAMIDDPDDPTRQWFADAGLARNLQKEAIDAKATEIEAEGWDFVTILRCENRQYFYSSDWQEVPDMDKKDAGVVIVVERDLSIETHTGLIKREESRPKTKPAKKDTGAKPRKTALDAITKKHMFHARRRKGAVLQRAFANDAGHAMRLVCMAMMKAEQAINIDAQANDDNDAVLDDSIVRTLAPYAADFDISDLDRKWAAKSGPLRNARIWGNADQQIKLWHTLLEIDGEALENLFSNLVAARVGNFNTYNGSMGDNPVALAMAETLNLPGQEAQWGLTLEEGDFDGLQNSALEAIATDVGAEPGKNGKATRAAIEAKGAGTYVLPTLTWGTEKDIGKRIAAADESFLATEETPKADTKAAE